MFKEYDVILATRPLDNVPVGTIGTVLIVYEGGNAYEVEFMDTEGTTLNVLTVRERDIKLRTL